MAACRIEPGSPECQSNAVPFFQYGSRYFTFFSHIYQKKIVIPVSRLVIRPTVGRLGYVLDDRLWVG